MSDMDSLKGNYVISILIYEETLTSRSMSSLYLTVQIAEKIISEVLEIRIPKLSYGSHGD